MSALVICLHCGATGVRACDCEPPKREPSRLAQVAALAALDADPSFRGAVRCAAWLVRSRVDA